LIALVFLCLLLQAMIQLTDSGDFMLYNEGRRPMFVSGKVLLPRTSTKLQHNHIVEVRISVTVKISY